MQFEVLKVEQLKLFVQDIQLNDSSQIISHFQNGYITHVILNFTGMSSFNKKVIIVFENLYFKPRLWLRVCLQSNFSTNLSFR